jgi:DNA invertase Pin-like site-specific DNA recombinase
MKAALYARVSTSLKYERQNPENQLLPLREFCGRRGWEITREYVDNISAVKKRPEYDRMLADARRHRFDTILVVKLDRIFRSTDEFVRVVRCLNHWRIRFLCTDQPIDTDRNDPSGQLLMHIIAAVAEFERSLISERVKAGIARTRAQGKKWGGRQTKAIDVNEVRRLRHEGYSLTRIGTLVGVNRNLVALALAGKQ